jgi:hypothetical protein
MLATGCAARKGDEVTGNIKVPQPARRRRGVTLIEAVLYTAVALGLIVGGLVFFQQASLQSRTAAVVRFYSALIAEARIVGGEVSSFTGANFENVLNLRGSIPSENWDATRPEGQRIRLPFPGMYASIAVSLTAAGVSEITLDQRNMPVSLCSRLFAATLGSTNYANGAVGAIFQDETLAPGPIHSYVLFPTLSPTEAATYCRTADQNGNGLVRTLIFFRTAD